MNKQDDMSAYNQHVGVAPSQPDQLTPEQMAEEMAQQAKQFEEQQDKELAKHGLYWMRKGFHIVKNPQTLKPSLAVDQMAFRFYEDGTILVGQNTHKKVPLSQALAIFGQIKTQPLLPQTYQPCANGELSDVVYIKGQCAIKLPLNHPLEMIYSSLCLM